jgi:serine/threonine-protein kinase
MTGERLGAVVAAGRAGLLESEERLLMGFAHQLGAALELRKTRDDLTSVKARRALQRDELVASGAEVLRICPECGLCATQREDVCPEDGARLLEEQVLPRTLQSRYRLERVLGSGGMGTVFLASDVRLSRKVAVKLVKSEHFDSAQARARLSQEARLIARIRHPGVVAVFDSGELLDGTTFLVTEHLPGRDLARVVGRHGRGSPEQAASLLAQAGEALEAAHREGLVHRDVKPENLFLVPKGGGFDVKVLDFGLAKAVRIDTHLTQTGQIVGTPAYMPPEVLKGGEAGPAADVYGLGAVAFLAITGRRLVLARSFADVLFEVMTQELPRASSLVDGLPAEVDALLAHALARDPALRPKSAAAWGAAVAAALRTMTPGPSGWPLDVAAGLFPPVRSEGSSDRTRQIG